MLVDRIWPRGLGQRDVGQRQYSLRYTGRYDTQDLGQLVLAWRDGQPVRLADVAQIELRPPERTSFSYQNGNEAVGLRVQRAPGANVLTTLEEVKQAVADLRDGPLRERGLGIEQSFDASLFIRRAVNLLIENLVVGALLALVCVWWFMRDGRANVVIASTIPVCLLATFCALQLGGRSINVISLAGLAFAVGMVVEGAIEVAGNIIRLKESGLPIPQAAHEGTRQVVPALFASTMTTIAVFLPVLFREDVEGQMFADLAVTISIAVAFSIVVAITVVPAAAGRWLGAHSKSSGYGAGWPWLIDPLEVAAVVDAAAAQGAAIAGHAMVNTVKRIKGGKVVETVPRVDLVSVTTPQVFRAGLLRKAHEKSSGATVTDDAELVERSGASVAVVLTSRWNLKITYPEDLAWAEAWLARAGG